MKVCPSCGNRNNRDVAKRCDQCGAELHAASSEAPVRQPSTNAQQPSSMNRARRFALPGVQDLTPEQDLANDLPVNGRHLLIGGPGTGKSVIALLRAVRLVRSKNKHAFLAYNRLLIHYCNALSPVQINASTWITCFKHNWRQQMGQNCPVLDQPWEIDWQGVMGTLGQAVDIAPPPSPYLIIDEGQDMPKEFFWALADLGYEHIFVAADFNQVLNPGKNVNRRELIDALEKSPRNVQQADAPKEKLFAPSAIIELKHNHRNPGPVARLAAHLCSAIANPQSPCTELRDSMRDADAPLLYGYKTDDAKRSLGRVCQGLIILADRNPHWLIGVLCPTKDVRDSYKVELDRALAIVQQRLDHGDPRIDVFDANKQPWPDFTRGGIVVLTAQSCKGLEFDLTAIADLHWYRDNLASRQLLYVMVSRAIERVILLRDLNQPCALDAILPKDANLLKRDP